MPPPSVFFDSAVVFSAKLRTEFFSPALATKKKPLCNSRNNNHTHNRDGAYDAG